MQHIQTKAILLQPSTIIQRAAPKIAAVLAGFSKPQVNDNNNDDAEDCSSISPYTIRRRTRPSSVSTNNNIAAATTSKTTTSSTTTTTKKSSIPAEDLIEWQTNHMPILSTRQLELSLLEIQRRMNRRKKRKEPEQQHQEEEMQTSATIQSTQYNNNNNEQQQKKEAAILIPICTVDGIPSILFTRRSASLSSHPSQICFPGGYYHEILDSTPNNIQYIDDDDDDMIGNNNNNEWTKRLVHTAVREMHEELQYDIESLGSTTGISHHARFQHDTTTATSSFITILGQTQPVPSMMGSRVTPIIGTINYDLPSSLHNTTEFETLFPGNPKETDWIFTIPIVDLIQNETSEPLQRWSSRENGNHDDDAKGNKKNKSKHTEYWGPVFPIPNEYVKKQDGDKIWGLTAIVLRPLLRKVFRPVFC